MKLAKYHIQAILYGVAVGDALGVPVEFTDRAYLKAHPLTDMIGFGTHHQPAGTWSDDSTMTFCLAEALLDEPFDLHKLANRFIAWVEKGYWTPHGEVFDIGNTTYAAIQRLKSTQDPTQAGATGETENGNGALMRILPLVLLTHNKPLAEAFELTRQVSALTHAHIRSVICCFYYLEFAKKLMTGCSPAQAYEVTNKFAVATFREQGVPPQEIQLLNRILSGQLPELPEQEIRGSGYVLHSLEASIWCLLQANSFEDAVLKAVNLGEDTDTTGAITGGLAALSFGPPGIPQNWMLALARKADIDRLIQQVIDQFVPQITLQDLPEPGDMAEANRFAHQFGGYLHSFEATSEVFTKVRAQLQTSQTNELSVDDLVTSLFFHFRAMRHGGTEPDQDFVNLHLALIRKKLENGPS